MSLEPRPVRIAWRARCHANAQRHVKILTIVGNERFRDFLTDALSQCFAGIEAAIRQQSLNLLTAPPVYLSTMRDCPSHGAEYVTQKGISRFITVLGVKQPEIIDICQKDRDGLAICAF